MLSKTLWGQEIYQKRNQDSKLSTKTKEFIIKVPAGNKDESLTRHLKAKIWDIAAISCYLDFCGPDLIPLST